jgi:hypothetical protein
MEKKSYIIALINVTLHRMRVLLSFSKEWQSLTRHSCVVVVLGPLEKQLNIIADFGTNRSCQTSATDRHFLITIHPGVLSLSMV